MAAYRTEAEALAHLDELRAHRERIKQEDAAVMAEIRSAVRAADATVVDGESLSRSTIIDHSGLSRRTVYQILDDKPPEDTTDAVD